MKYIFDEQGCCENPSNLLLINIDSFYLNVAYAECEGRWMAATECKIDNRYYIGVVADYNTSNSLEEAIINSLEYLIIIVKGWKKNISLIQEQIDKIKEPTLF